MATSGCSLIHLHRWHFVTNTPVHWEEEAKGTCAGQNSTFTAEWQDKSTSINKKHTKAISRLLYLSVAFSTHIRLSTAEFISSPVILCN